MRSPSPAGTSVLTRAQHGLPPCVDGVGEMDEESFRREGWFHRPTMDIWGIEHGVVGKLARRGVYDFACVCVERPEVMRPMLGKNGAALVDHARGLSPQP